VMNWIAKWALGVVASVAVAGPITAKEITRNVTFPKGASTTTLKGTISGRDGATFRLSAGSGQTLQVLFSPSNRSCYFNVFRPSTAEAAHIGSTSGNEYGESQTIKGVYRLQVYLMRNAARRNESCRYSLSIELTGKPGGSSAGVSDVVMKDRCKGEAAQMYGVQPRNITVAGIRAVPTGFEIDGTADKGAEGRKKLRCIFKADRSLTRIMALTPDGN
jgi:hypothetical protein